MNQLLAILFRELIESVDFVEIYVKGDQSFDDNDYFIEELENTTTIIFPTFLIDKDS